MVIVDIVIIEACRNRWIFVAKMPKIPILEVLGG
jgi:hypothetical protein